MPATTPKAHSIRRESPLWTELKVRLPPPQQFKRILKEKDDILADYEADEYEEESIPKIANARTKKFSAPSKKPVNGGIRCFVKGEHCLETNPELKRLHATGLRTPGAKPNQQPPSRKRSSSRRRPFTKRIP